MERETRRALVLHNRSLFAEVVADLLRKQPDLEVLNATATTQDAPARVRDLRPEVVVVDSQDAGLDPDEVIPSLLRENPHLRVLCLTMGQICPNVCFDRCTPVSTKSELMQILCS